MATKKFDVQIDVQSGDVKIATDRVLSLKEELRILERFKNTPGLTAEQFGVLSNKINSTKDTLAATNARGKEFFSTLSLLPGPVGAFSNQIDNSIGLLKTFTKFSAKDIKTQFVGLVNDIKDVGRGLLQVTGIQRLYEGTANLTAKALNAVGIGANSASKGVKAFSAALVASGIGVAIFLLQKLITSLMDSASATKEAESANDRLARSIKNINEQLNDEETLIKRSTDYRAKVAKLAGKSEQELFEIRKNGALEELRRIDERLKKEGEFDQLYKQIIQARRDGLISDEEYVKRINEAQDERVKTQQKRDAKQAEYQTMIIDRMQAVKDDASKKDKDREEKSRAASDKIRQKELDDLETYEQLKIQLQREYNSLSLKEGLERSLQELENQRLVEEDKIKKLSIGDKRIKELLTALETNFGIKRNELVEKYNKEQLEIYQEFENKLLSLLQSVYKDNTKLQEDVLNRQLQIQIDQYKKQVDEFNKRNTKLRISSEEQARYITALELQTQEKLTDIQIDAINKGVDRRLKANQNSINDVRNYIDQLTFQIDQSINDFIKSKGKENLFEKVIGIETASIGEDNIMKKVVDAYKGIDLREVLRMRQKVLEQSSEFEMQTIQKGFDEQLKILTGKRDLYAKDSDEYKFFQDKIIDVTSKKDEKLKELGETRVQNNRAITQQIMDLDRLEIDSKRAVADKTLETFGQISSLIGSIQSVYDAAYQQEQKRLDDRLKLETKGTKEYESIQQEKYNAEQRYLKRVKALQISQAIFDAGVAIARIVMDTQRAIISYKASVALLGPPGQALAAAYSAQARVQQAISIGIITAQTIAKLSQISGQSGSVEAPDTSPGGARGMEKGGLIKGRRHAQGGTMIEAEDGEAVINRNSTAMFGPLLSALNQMGGGTSFSNNFVTLQDKPLVSNPATDSSMYIKTYVVESDLTNAQQKQARLKELSTL